MKVLLVEPPKGQWFMFGDVIGPNTGYTQLLAYLEEQGIEAELLDCCAQGIGWEDFWSAVKAKGPDVIGIGAAVPWAHNAMRAFEIIHANDPGMILCAGGLHFTFMADRTMGNCPGLSYIIRGEGELTFTELLREIQKESPDLNKIKGLTYRNKNGEVVHNEDREFIKDLDTLPMPAYHKIPIKKYHFRNWPPFMVINSSRGCPYTCTFCAQWKFYGQTWRGRSAKKLVDEIELLNRQYGIEVFEFGDDNFNYLRERNIGFLDELERRNLKIHWMMEARVDTILRDQDLLPRMKKLGLFFVLFGAESGTNENLKIYRKGQTTSQVREAMRVLKRNDVATITCFILGARHETREAILSTIDYAKELDPTVPVFTPLTPLPGTELYAEAKGKGWIAESDWAMFDLAHATMGTETLSREEVADLVQYAYKQFYRNPMTIVKRLFSRNSFVRECTWAGIKGQISFVPPKKTSL